MHNPILFASLLLAILLGASCHELPCFSDVPEMTCHSGYRWRFIDGQCVHKSVCTLDGANKFLTREECRRYCGPSFTCSRPQAELECADGKRWRFDPDTGDCRLYTVCGLSGQNKFVAKTECLQTCNPTSNCVTPKWETECPSHQMWRYNPDTGYCVYQTVCGREGQNKFSQESDCIRECNPAATKQDCVTPPFESFCLGGKRWRFNPITRNCELREVCNVNGPNTFLSKSACLAKCLLACSAPATYPGAKCSQHYAWWYSGRYGQCQLSQVCPPNGPNKFASQAECINTCQPCTAPAVLPNFHCLEALNAWRFNGFNCEFSRVCPLEGANRYNSKEECQHACRVCNLEPDPAQGDCEGAARTRFYYDPSSRTCLQFFFYGCSGPGNANSFDRREDCQAACSPPQPECESSSSSDSSSDSSYSSDSSSSSFCRPQSKCKSKCKCSKWKSEKSGKSGKKSKTKSRGMLKHAADSSPRSGSNLEMQSGEHGRRSDKKVDESAEEFPNELFDWSFTHYYGPFSALDEESDSDFSREW